MIIVRVLGGLGNQLFQYALGRRLTYDKDEPLVLDISWYPKERDNFADHTFKLDKFNASFSIADEQDVREAVPGGRTVTNIARRLCRYCPTVLQDVANYYLEIQKNYPSELMPSACDAGVPHGYHFEPSILDITNNAYLDGFWQTEKYFNEIKSVIRSDLSISEPLTGRGQEVAKLLSETTSVGLHVRRGIYVKLGNALAPSYFESAVSVIASNVNNPHFFVFSDDIEWTKNNLSISYPTTYVTNNYSNTDYEDLRLMGRCDHNIISNSTFSWWGTWLGEQPGQTVIAPSVWYMNQPTRDLDIVPDRWHVIDV